jgi:hypothetical protein
MWNGFIFWLLQITMVPLKLPAGKTQWVLLNGRKSTWVSILCLKINCIHTWIVNFYIEMILETENVLNILESWLVVLCIQFVIVSLTGWGVAIYGGYKIFAGGKKEEVHWIKLSLLQLRKLYLLACSYVDYECDLPCLFVYNWVLQCCYDVR